MLEEKSIISSKKSQSKQMPKSSTDIHLRGIYVPLTPSKQKMTILKYRKPLTRKDLTLNRLNLNITATQVKRFCLTLKDT